MTFSVEHIVIGGGPSGTSLTSTLIHNGHNVLIIERGDENDSSSFYQGEQGIANISQVCLLIICKLIFYGFVGLLLPEYLSWTSRSYHSNFSIPQISIPQERLNLYQKIYPQGHGIGGTTNINAQIFTLGHPAIFDMFWPDDHWNAEHMSNYLESVFLNTEYTTSIITASGLFRGIIRTSTCCKESVLPSAHTSVGCDQYFNYSKHLYWDLRYRNLWKNSGSEQECAYLISAKPDSTAYDRRVTAADILKPKEVAPSAGKLFILRKCQVLHIEFDGLQAVGVVVKDLNCDGCCSYFQNGVKKDNIDSCRCGSLRAAHGGEVILSAGAFETPRILLSSGLGETSRQKIAHSHEKYVTFSISFSSNRFT
jgi:choline dehydrogenase-like flavoprotein